MRLNRLSKIVLKIGTVIDLFSVLIARIYISNWPKFLQRMPSLRMLTIIKD